MMQHSKLSEAQQSVLDRLAAGGKLRFVMETGRYRLSDDGGERTVFPNTAQALLNAGYLSMELGGECVLAKPAVAVPVFDGTPPADFPREVIVMDRAFAKRHPSKGFYLRVGTDEGHVATIWLDNEVTPVGARRAAQALGHEPSHWMDVADCCLCAF